MLAHNSVTKNSKIPKKKTNKQTNHIGVAELQENITNEWTEETNTCAGKQHELDICHDYTNVEKFVHHIRVIYKKLEPKRSLSKITVEYIQDLVVLFIEKVCTRAFYYMQSCRPARVTLLDRDIEIGILQVFPKEMNDLASKFISNTLEKYTKHSNKPYSKKQPQITIPPTRCRAYIRYFIGGYKISRKAEIVMAAGIEYMLTELLHAVVISNHPKGTEFIGIDEIKFICENDPGLSELFSRD